MKFWEEVTYDFNGNVFFSLFQMLSYYHKIKNEEFDWNDWGWFKELHVGDILWSLIRCIWFIGLLII